MKGMGEEYRIKERRRLRYERNHFLEETKSLHVLICEISSVWILLKWF
jgi:hypothetical protein